jgi:hypothetical protein
VHVVGDLYGAENFGHQVADNWLGFFSLRNAGVREHEAGERGTVSTHLHLGQDCEHYRGYALAGFQASSGRTEEKFRQLCARHTSALGPLFFDTVSQMAVGETMCFERLVVGMRDVRAFTRAPKEVEAFHDEVLSRFGLDPEAAPPNQTLIVTKKARGSSLAMSPVETHPDHIYGRLVSNTSTAELVHRLTGSGLTPRVRVREFPGGLTFEEQVRLLANFSNVILPGGGLGFVLFFAAKGTHVSVSAYKFWDELQVLKMPMCYANVRYFFPLKNATYPHDKILDVVRQGLVPRRPRCCGDRELSRACPSRELLKVSRFGNRFMALPVDVDKRHFRARWQADRTEVEVLAG